MKKLLTGLMAVVMMAGLAGCGSKDDGAGEGSDTAKKELTVYTNSGYKPYEMVDEKGNLYGFDIDVMNEAAKLAGYTVKWEDVDRSEERRVGKECRIGCRSRWSPYH